MNTTNVTCPCSNFSVNFTRNPAWNETYIGTSYFQFRAQDYRDSYGNASTNVTVLKDDVNIEYWKGNNSDIDRSNSAEFGVRLYDTDRNLYVSSENMTFWTYYNNSWKNVGDNSTDSEGNASIILTADCTMEVDQHDWKANQTGIGYKDVESENYTIIIRDQMNITISVNKTTDVHYNDVLKINGTVYDCFGPIDAASVETKIFYPNGTYTGSLNLTQSDSSGQYVGIMTSSWTANGTYKANASGYKTGAYFYNNSAADYFNHVSPVPVNHWIKTYLTDMTELSEFLHNEKIRIRSNITDLENNTNQVRISVGARTWYPATNQLMTCVQAITNGCIYEYNVTADESQAGIWNITINTSDSTNFENISVSYFSVTHTPDLASESVTPSSAGWGETFTFDVQVTEPDMDTVTLTLWEGYDGSNWTKAIEQNYTPSGGGPFTKTFTLNSTNCSVTSTDAVGGMYCSLHNWSMIGTRYWKFNVTDYKRGVDETTSSTYNIEIDNVSIEYSAGNSVNVNRSSGTVALQLRIRDIDREVYVEENVSGRIYNDVVYYDNVTDTNGYLSYDVSPSCSYITGAHNWRGGTYNNSIYEDRNSSQYTFTVIGWLADELEQPIYQQYVVSDQIFIRNNLTSECADLVPGATITMEVLNENNDSYSCGSVNDEGTGWYNCTWDSTAFDEGNYSLRINSSLTFISCHI
ncbi:hypothetical protein ACFLYT_01330, partial [Nanoarchaeota archaeon]